METRLNATIDRVRDHNEFMHTILFPLRHSYDALKPMTKNSWFIHPALQKFLPVFKVNMH